MFKRAKDGNPMEMVDKGDYGAPDKVAKEDKARTRAKSESGKPAGNPMEMNDAGDYTLSSVTGKVLAKGIKTLREALNLRKRFGGSVKKNTSSGSRKRLSALSSEQWETVKEAVDDVVKNFKTITGIDPVTIIDINGQFHQDIIDRSFDSIEAHLESAHPAVAENNEMKDEFLYKVDDGLMEAYAKEAIERTAPFKSNKINPFGRRKRSIGRKTSTNRKRALKSHEAFIRKTMLKRKAEADGNRQEMIDRGDYGADTDNYKKDRSRMKGKSETSKPAGNRQEMVDAGDYTLSSKGGNVIAKGIKTLREALELKKKHGGIIRKTKLSNRTAASIDFENAIQAAIEKKDVDVLTKLIEKCEKNKNPNVADLKKVLKSWEKDLGKDTKDNKDKKNTKESIKTTALKAYITGLMKQGMSFAKARKMAEIKFRVGLRNKSAAEPVSEVDNMPPIPKADEPKKEAPKKPAPKKEDPKKEVKEKQDIIDEIVEVLDEAGELKESSLAELYAEDIPMKPEIEVPVGSKLVFNKVNNMWEIVPDTQETTEVVTADYIEEEYKLKEDIINEILSAMEENDELDQTEDIRETISTLITKTHDELKAVLAEKSAELKLSKVARTIRKNASKNSKIPFPTQSSNSSEVSSLENGNFFME